MLSWKRRRALIAALFVVVASGLSPLAATPATASPSSDKAKNDKELAAAEAALETATGRARQAGRIYAQASQQMPAAEQAVATATGRVAAATVRADQARKAADVAQVQLTAAQQKLTTAQQAVEASRDRLGEFVSATYQGRPYMAAASLLSGGGPEDTLARLGYVDSIAGGQRRALQEVSKARLVAAENRATVADKKAKADAAEDAAKGALDDAQAEQAAAVSAKNRVAALVAQRQSALAVANEEKASSQKQYEATVAESRRIAAELREAARRAREAARNNGNSTSRAPAQPDRGGALSMPVNGWKSSDYGWRYDPYYHVSQLHAGTDFAAARGTPIWAAASGRVIRAGWNGGYGNYTCIYHYDISGGRGLSTCYGHQSSILVSKGQYVQRGQVIGRVGTTGASTGNHLHFEVRIDGDPVNPLRWL